MSKRRSFLAAAACALPLLAASGCGIGNAQARLRSAIDAKKPTLDSCYHSALVRNKSTAGDMRLWVHLDQDSGMVQKVEVTNAGLNDPALQQCVQNALVGTRIDPKPKANLKVDYTLRFTPST